MVLAVVGAVAGVDRGLVGTRLGAEVGAPCAIAGPDLFGEYLAVSIRACQSAAHCLTTRRWLV